jgi:hypothetical protein
MTTYTEKLLDSKWMPVLPLMGLIFGLTMAIFRQHDIVLTIYAGGWVGFMLTVIESRTARKSGTSN